MRTDPNCVFCKIVAGQIPCFRLYEDERTLAFMDINPGNPGHALAIAKEHWENLAAMPALLLGPVLNTAQRVAKAIEAALRPDGINLLQANGSGAAQSVFHFHVHILPRRVGDELKMNWGHRPGDMAAIKAAYERIKAAL
ncbi:MAG: HIT family protein [Alphaproteobacteria bacterium]